MNYVAKMTLIEVDGPELLLVVYPFDDEAHMMTFKQDVDTLFAEGREGFCNGCERIDAEDYEPERDESRD